MPDSCFQSLQNQMMGFTNRAATFMPEEYRGELWVYAAGYVFLYTLIMLFQTPCMKIAQNICFVQLQNQMMGFTNRAATFMPEEYRGELWVYAAGYVFLYTLIMLFQTSCMKIAQNICFVQLQNQMMGFTNRAATFMPEEYRGELWVYAAGYVFLYTLIMLFQTSCVKIAQNICFVQLQNQMMGFTNRAATFMPEEYRGELWVYAAGYVFLYTLIMLFITSTFGFILNMVYTILITMLILRYFGLGPLASPHSPTRHSHHPPPVPTS